jgi:hypothetical protein
VSQLKGDNPEGADHPSSRGHIVTDQWKTGDNESLAQHCEEKVHNQDHQGRVCAIKEIPYSLLCVVGIHAVQLWIRVWILRLVKWLRDPAVGWAMEVG